MQNSKNFNPNLTKNRNGVGAAGVGASGVAAQNQGDAFQRLSYDPAAYETDLRQSTRPFLYTIDPIYGNTCGKVCRPDDIGYLGKVGTSIDKAHSLVDTESDLMLLNYRSSKAPEYKYQPKFNKYCDASGYPNGGGISSEVLDQDKCRDLSDKWNFPDCTDLRTEYARVTYPPCDLKCTGVNRFQPICLDPQDPSRWLHPSEIGINYRMVVKDNHRPCIPLPMDQQAALPKPLTAKNVPALNQDDRHGLPVYGSKWCGVIGKDYDYGHKLFCTTGYKTGF